MKKQLSITLLLLLCPPILAANKKSKENSNQQQKPTTEQQQQPVATFGDEDEEVVLSSFAQMLTCFGQIAADPHNPAVVAPNVTAMFASFVRVLLQVFRDTPLRHNKLVMSHLEGYFENMSKEQHAKLVSLIMSKAYELHLIKQEDKE